MKTTVDIADPILDRARQVARDRGTTLKALIEHALWDFMEAEQKDSRAFKYRPHTFKGNGLRDGLQEGDWSRILEHSYEGRGG